METVTEVSDVLIVVPFTLRRAIQSRKDATCCTNVHPPTSINPMLRPHDDGGRTQTCEDASAELYLGNVVGERRAAPPPVPP